MAPSPRAAVDLWSNIVGKRGTCVTVLLDCDQRVFLDFFLLPKFLTVNPEIHRCVLWLHVVKLYLNDALHNLNLNVIIFKNN